MIGKDLQADAAKALPFVFVRAKHTRALQVVVFIRQAGGEGKQVFVICEEGCGIGGSATIVHRAPG